MMRCVVASANPASSRPYPTDVNRLDATAVSRSVQRQTPSVSGSAPSMKCRFFRTGVVPLAAIVAAAQASARSQTRRAVARTPNAILGSNVYLRRGSATPRLVVAIWRVVRGCVPEIALAIALRRDLIARPMMPTADGSVSAERRRRSRTGVVPLDVSVESLSAQLTTLFVGGRVRAVRCQCSPRAVRRLDVNVTDRIVLQVTLSACGCVLVSTRRSQKVAPCRAARVKDLTVRQMTRSVLASARAANSQTSPKTVDRHGAIVEALTVPPTTWCVVASASRVNSQDSPKGAYRRDVNVVVR